MEKGRKPIFTTKDAKITKNRIQLFQNFVLFASFVVG